MALIASGCGLQTQAPLSAFDPTWRPLQQTHIVPGLVTGCGGEGCEGPPMVLLGWSLYNFSCSSNQIEPFDDATLARAVDVQMPWEPHPQRRHNQVPAKAALI